MMQEPLLPQTQYLDPKAGLMTTMGNDALYAELLERYGKTQSHFFEQYEEALRNNDKALALRHVHNLKGLSGNIGAKGVEKLASKLEYALQHNEENLLETLKEQIAQVLTPLLDEVASVRTALMQVPHVSAKEDATKAHALYQELKRKLQECDATACDTLKALLENDAVNRYKIDEVAGWILNYQFEEALERLEQIFDEKH